VLEKVPEDKELEVEDLPVVGRKRPRPVAENLPI